MARKISEATVVALVLLLGLAVLGGCAADQPPAPTVRIVCPSLTTYSRAEQADLSAELKEHPELVAVDRYLEDYSALRGQVRACHGKRS